MELSRIELAIGRIGRLCASLAAVLSAVSLLATPINNDQSQRFELLGTLKGLGGQFASAIAPGSSMTGECLYLSYEYEDNTFDVVGVDPDSGAFTVFGNPTRTEFDARCMVTGPDGNIYLGTYPHGHLLKLDTKAKKLEDLGASSTPNEQFIWAVTFGRDNCLYAGTYPNAKLVRYSPRSGKIEDFGRMDPREEYLRYLAAGDDGFVYGGIGSSQANVVAFDTATGEHREILPEGFRVATIARVFRGTDGRIYANVGSTFFLLRGWSITEIRESDAARPFYANKLKDGRTVTSTGQTLQLKDPKSNKVTERKFAYYGRPLKLFRICLDGDGNIFGSSELPADLVMLPKGKRDFMNLGQLGSGEVYSMGFIGSRLLLAIYGGGAPLLCFDATKPFDHSKNTANPSTLQFLGADSGWRPKALARAADGKFYVGSDLGYGKLGGMLVSWDASTGIVESVRNLVRDQSIVSLVAWRDFIVGGTSILGGGGSHPTQTEARVFRWSLKSKRMDLDVSPVHYGSVGNLVLGKDGLVYGFAGRTLFAFDPSTGSVTERAKLPDEFNNTIYNSVALSPDGEIWGLTGQSVFAVRPTTGGLDVLARAPAEITGGAALDSTGVYLICGPSVYKYKFSNTERR